MVTHMLQRAWGPRSGVHDGKGARRGTLTKDAQKCVSPANDPKAEGIRWGGSQRLLQSPLTPQGVKGPAPVGKGDETGRFVRPPRGRPG